MLKYCTRAAVAAVGLSLGLVSVGHAGAVKAISGHTYGGWKIITSDNLQVVVDSTDNGRLVLEKFATFTDNSPLTITFVQDGAATSQIDFTDEVVTNITGSNWNNFQFSLSSGSTLGTPSFDGPAHTFVPPSDPGVNLPGISFGSQLVAYSGSQADGTVANWGFNGDGDLLIDANPGTAGSGISQSFNFVETPGTSVPIPAAAWTGLSGLMGLGLLRLVRKSRAIA